MNYLYMALALLSILAAGICIVAGVFVFYPPYKGLAPFTSLAATTLSLSVAALCASKVQE